jgi:hypothetical protein
VTEKQSLTQQYQQVQQCSLFTLFLQIWCLPYIYSENR